MSDAELTTVAPDEAVIHEGLDVRVHAGLAPDTAYEIDGFSFRTLPAPGEQLARFATVNDVHFGETVAGIVDGSDIGPVFSSEPDEEPYPEFMNRGAIEEITLADPDVVIVKGDITSEGTEEEYERFLEVYGSAFGERLVHVRGNHESYYGTDIAAWPTQEVVLPGARLAILDTSRQYAANGRITAEQIDWLDALAADSDRPVLVFGHHHVWNPDSSTRPADYFGIDPDDSEAFVALVARRPEIVGYFAGHTHRNRVRHFTATGEMPWVEVACVKDYPGAWAEYRVYEGGVVQIHRRISTPEALAWTDKTRAMYAGLYHKYAFGELSDRCFLIEPREA